MLHLAKVLKRDPSSCAELQILARQQLDTTWQVMQPSEDDSLLITMPTDKLPYNEQALVVLELSDDQERKVRTIHDATDWIMDIIAMPMFLSEEQERMEQWRQALTLESQELARRNLELESRLEYIQALEERLRREREN